ncbi:MAG TPA: prepilin-type N-terminal cleavage/methylation domain-containing protein [Gemmatimonadaceae bacterium]|nr:prepilin-type N-terminal cleavage/methylation domain-containing protein [Gemmatimonadaceae bacterium]
MPTRNRTGFTLIELLIVVVIIGILASIAIPKFSNTKREAYIASMRTDLRNLATAQESYFYTNDVYTTNPASLNFTSSPGVVLSIPEATAGGWSGVTTHPLVGTTKCALFMGKAAPVAPATVEGQVTCG